MSQPLNVWQFWTGPMPDWVKLTTSTADHNCPTLRRMDDNDFISIAGADLPPYYHRLKPHHKSDVFRAYMLAHYGGVYTDTDNVVVSDLSQIVRLKGDADIVSYGINHRKRKTVVSALVGCEPGSVLATAWWNRCKELLNNMPGGKLGWGALGPWGLTVAMQRHPHAKVLDIGWHRVHQIKWPKDRTWWIAQGTDEWHEKQLNKDALCFMLTHRSWERINHLTNEQMLYGNYRASYVLRKALGISTEGIDYGRDTQISGLKERRQIRFHREPVQRKKSVRYRGM